MIHFDTDYMEGAHPEVMRRLLETNLERLPDTTLSTYVQGQIRFLSNSFLSR